MAPKSFSSLPDAIKKRDMIHSSKPDEVALKALGEAFESAGGLSDAIDFYAQIKDGQALKRLRAKAAEEGNSFLILKIAKYLAEDKAGLDEDLLKCARQAEAQGKIRYAIKAYERLEMTQEAEKLRERISEDADVQAELQNRVFIPVHTEEEAEAE